MANSLLDSIKFTPHDYLDAVYLTSKQGPIYVENYFEINYSFISEYITNKTIKALQEIKPNDLRQLKSLLGLNAQANFSDVVKSSTAKISNLSVSMLLFLTGQENPSAVKKQLRNLDVYLPSFLIDLVTSINCAKRIHNVQEFTNVTIVPTKCQVAVPGFSKNKILIKDYIQLVTTQSDLVKILQLLNIDKVEKVEAIENLFQKPKFLYDISFVPLQDGTVKILTGVGLEKDVIFLAHLIKPRHKFLERNILKYRSIVLSEDEIKNAFRNKCIGLSINDGNIYENINSFVSIDKDIIVNRDLAFRLQSNFVEKDNDKDRRFEEPGVDFDDDCENIKNEVKELDPKDNIKTPEAVVDYSPNFNVDIPTDNDDFVQYIREKTKSTRSKINRKGFSKSKDKEETTEEEIDVKDLNEIEEIDS